MISHHGSVPSWTDQLVDSLRNVIPEARFDIRRFGIFNSREIRDIYHQRHPTDVFRIGTARPVLNDADRQEIERILRSMFSNYIEGDIIGNGFTLVSGGIVSIPVAQLIDGVVRAAAILGAEETARVAGRWANGGPIRYQRCALLDGLSLNQSLVVNNGMQIDTLSNSSTDAFRNLAVGADLDLAPSSVTGKVKVAIACSSGPAFFLLNQRAIVASKRTAERSDALGPIQRNFWDIFCKALSLAADSYVGCVMEWIEPSEMEPFGLITGGRSISQRTASNSVVPQSMSQANLDEALKIFRKLSEDANPDNRPWLAIDRWVGSKKPQSFADQFIDLRIALEALFGGGSEITLRLATRGAWYLGNDPEDRLRIYTDLRAAYRSASDVIHAGDKLRCGQESRSVLSRGQSVCRDAIIKWLEYPWKPDDSKWNAMIMGA